MAKILIACDEEDTSLGDFFLACKNHLSQYFKSKDISITELGSNQLNDLAISLYINHLPQFIFGAYSHGDDNSLLKAADVEYVSIEKNGSAFKGGFVYTFSCSSGKELGRDLVGVNQCQCFIGYSKPVFIWTNFFPPFVECANHGLIQFFDGSDTHTALDAMKKKYNDEIDKMYEINPLVAASLVDNRKALIMHGNNICLKDFEDN